VSNTTRDAEQRWPDDEVALGLLADPNFPHDLTNEVARTLPRSLEDQLRLGLKWSVQVVSERLPADESGPRVGDAARSRRQEEGWDLLVCVTDLPRHDGRRLWSPM
jgi:hypothetical protein